MQCHTMDGDTPKERLEVLEPVTEDWHWLVCLLAVSNSVMIWGKVFPKKTVELGIPKKGLKQVADVQRSTCTPTSLIHFDVFYYSPPC